MHLSDRDYRRQFYAAVGQNQAGGSRDEAKDYDAYYVSVYEGGDGPAGPDLIAEIIDAIDFTTGGSVQLLSGYRGAGKTTELMRLCRQIDRGRYLPIYWDVEDYFNTELPLDEGAFLVGMAAGLVESLPEGEVSKENLWDRVREFFGRIEVSLDASGQFSAGPLKLDLRAALRDDETFRDKVRKVLKHNRALFRREVHAFFNDVLDVIPGGRVPVFIVDSVDHFRGRSANFEEVRESIESLFSVYAEELAIPGMHVIYTVPIYAQPMGWPGQLWPVLNVKVKEKDGTECQAGIELLREVLVKRAPGGDIGRLLSDDDVKRVILSSGGLFRDLFRMVAGLLLKAGRLPVGDLEIASVERQQRSAAVVGLSGEQIEILTKVRRTKQLQVPREMAAEAWDLQAMGAVLCYRNGSVDWFGVHPLLEPLLPDPGLGS